MKVLEAIDALQKIVKHAGSHAADLEFVIPVYSPGTVGGEPHVGVQVIYKGIDWDAGRVFVGADYQLTKLSQEEVKAVMASVRSGQSWHAFQQHKKFTDEIKQLKARIAELESGKSVE